jgi:hypothetical protein
MKEEAPAPEKKSDLQPAEGTLGIGIWALLLVVGMYSIHLYFE